MLEPMMPPPTMVILLMSRLSLDLVPKSSSCQDERPWSGATLLARATCRKEAINVVDAAAQDELEIVVARAGEVGCDYSIRRLLGERIDAQSIGHSIGFLLGAILRVDYLVLKRIRFVVLATLSRRADLAVAVDRLLNLVIDTNSPALASRSSTPKSRGRSCPQRLKSWSRRSKTPAHPSSSGILVASRSKLMDAARQRPAMPWVIGGVDWEKLGQGFGADGQ